MVKINGNHSFSIRNRKLWITVNQSSLTNHHWYHWPTIIDQHQLTMRTTHHQLASDLCPQQDGWGSDQGGAWGWSTVSHQWCYAWFDICHMCIYVSYLISMIQYVILRMVLYLKVWLVQQPWCIISFLSFELWLVQDIGIRLNLIINDQWLTRIDLQGNRG